MQLLTLGTAALLGLLALCMSQTGLTCVSAAVLLLLLRGCRLCLRAC
jgi:hypothetical protein